MNATKICLLILALCFSTLQGAVVQSTENQLVEAPEKTKIGSFAGVSFIYWTPRVDALTYAQTGRNSLETVAAENLTDFLNLPQGTDLAVNWQWEPGFKANLGWDFRSQWQIQLEYTWLYSKAKGSKSSIGGIFPNVDIFPLDIVTALGAIDRAKATWSLHYQLLHLELGREYRYTSALKFRTSFGATLTDQTQHYSTLYVIPPFNFTFGQGSISSSQAVNFNFSGKQEVFGTGLRLAFAPTWYLTKWFGFYGKIGMSYLWMYYDVKRKDSGGTEFPISGQLTGVKIKLTNIETKVRTMKLFFDANLGFFFETPTFCTNFRFSWFLGWEAHIWINQTYQINLGRELSRYDLTMQGLTTKLQLDF